MVQLLMKSAPDGIGKGETRAMSEFAAGIAAGGTADPPPMVEKTLLPRVSDIGGLEVQRLLPSSRRRMVGPFIFFDRMGPAHFTAGEGLDVRPHPHIGLATVTYLFSGEIVHRDSLGSLQTIAPGAVNWMIAGRGIVHSERFDRIKHPAGGELFGLQVWVALPKAVEEMAPAFSHHPVDGLPRIEGEGWRARLIAGTFEGEQAPTPVHSPTVYVDFALAAAGRVPIAAEHEERAVYVVEGTVSLDGHLLEPGILYVLVRGQPVTLTAAVSSRLILIGGAAMDGPRHVWWNFVASDPARIEQAKADWKAGRFVAVPGESDFIPLPE